MDERRSAQRRRTFWRGSITHSNRAVSIDCTVRDVSAGGMRLELPAETPLPEMFEISVPQLELVFRPVHVTWARGRELGVRYEQAGGQTGAEAPSTTGGVSLAERVARLEHELAKLTRQFAEFRTDVKRYRNEE